MKKRLTIIQLVSHFDMGGAERIAINISKSKNDGVEYHMVEVVQGTSPFTAEFIKELNESQIAYHRSPIRNNKLAILLFPFHFVRLLKEIKPDVIHTHTEMPDLALYLTHLVFPRSLKKVKIIRTLHNTQLWNQWKWLGNHVEQFMIRHRANVSNSKMITGTYQKEFGPDANIKLIYNGFSKIPQKTYENLVPGKINVLFAGRFVPQKGIDTLIDIVKVVDPNHFFFHIAGKGELEHELKRELEHRQNVSITGPIYNLSMYLGSFDYVLIPSVHEGLNSLSIEASLSATPVIINDIDGLNETVPEDYPLKVSQNSIEEYSAIFEKLKGLNSNMFAEKSYGYALEKFSMQKMQSEYESLYAQS